jgi:hypothetical protein
MSLLNGKKGKDLGFSDFVSSAVRGLFMPYFSLPIIVLGVGFGFAIEFVVAPLIANGLKGTGEFGALAGVLVSIFVIAIITSIFTAVYGQIYAALASSAKTSAPTMGEAMAVVGQRGLSVFAAGLLVGLATVAVIIVGFIVVAGAFISNAGGVTYLLFLASIVVVVYFLMRLGQAGWFAADGMGAIDAIKASWSRTPGHLLTIFFWGLGGVVVFNVVGWLISQLTGPLPDSIGGAIGTGVGLVFTYASGAVLYRRITAK